MQTIGVRMYKGPGRQERTAEKTQIGGPTKQIMFLNAIRKPNTFLAN